MERIKRTLKDGELKALAAISHIRASTNKNQIILDDRVSDIEQTGISEEDVMFLRGVIEENRAQIINPDLHLMSLEVIQRKEPMSMSNIYYMIARQKDIKKEHIEPEVLLMKINAFFGFDVRKRKRTRHIVDARFLTMKYMKNKTGISLSDIGKLLGNFDHTSVIHGINAINRYIETDPKINMLWLKMNML